MNEKEAVDKIKGLKGGVEKLKSLFAKFTEEEVKLSEVKLKDGSTIVISTDAPEVGATVEVVTDAGNVAAPDGKYELEDGSTIEVGDGKITAVAPGEEKEVEVEAAALDPEIEKRFAALEERLAAYEKAVGMSEQKLTDASKVIEAQKIELKKQFEIQKETFAIVEKLAALPDHKGVEEKSKIDMSKVNRLAELSKTLQTLKNK